MAYYMAENLDLSPSTCLYLNASALFAGETPAWEAMKGSDLEFNWGSNDHTMVSIKTIMDALIGILTDVDDDAIASIQRVLGRIGTLAPDLLIDLEN